MLHDFQVAVTILTVKFNHHLSDSFKVEKPGHYNIHVCRIYCRTVVSDSIGSVGVAEAQETTVLTGTGPSCGRDWKNEPTRMKLFLTWINNGQRA